MKFKVIIALAIVMLCGFTHADENTKTDKLRELVKLMDMDSMVDTIYSQMEVVMKNISTQMDVKPSEQPIFDEYHSEMTSLVRKDMSWEKMEPFVMDIYSRNFTEKEIDDLLVFYKTETGQSLINKTPVVMQESILMSQELIKSSIPKIQEIAKSLGEDLAKSREQN